MPQGAGSKLGEMHRWLGRLLSDGGRLVQVGLMGGLGTAPLPMDRLVFGHLQILGTVMKSRTREVKQAMVHRFKERWLREFTRGGLMPVIDSVLPLSEAPDAHRRMEANLNAGKIVLLPPPGEGLSARQ